MVGAGGNANRQQNANNGLSPKQNAAIARAAPKQRAALRAQYMRQRSQNQQRFIGPIQRRPAPKRAPRAAQAPAVRVPRPLGGARNNLSYAFDGFDKRHLPVDEVTAPYTVTNFIGTMEFATKSDMDQVIVVCPRMLAVAGQEAWVGPLADYIAVCYDASQTVGSTLTVLHSLRSQIVDAPPPTADVQYFSVRARLHNLSTKLECLGTNTGLYPPGSAYIGCVPCIENGVFSKGSASGLTIKQAWAEDSISVGYLRSIPAASLVNKPIMVNAAVAENVSYKQWRDLAVPNTGTNVAGLPFLSSLEPIVIYVPRCGTTDTVVNYRLVVGQQWCSRHPHSVMLRSTQKQHGASSPDVWHKAVSAVKDIGIKAAERMGEAAVNNLVRSLT
jgi:hypothetical protein